MPRRSKASLSSPLRVRSNRHVQSTSASIHLLQEFQNHGQSVTFPDSLEISNNPGFEEEQIALDIEGINLDDGIYLI